MAIESEFPQLYFQFQSLVRQIGIKSARQVLQEVSLIGDPAQQAEQMRVIGARAMEQVRKYSPSRVGPEFSRIESTVERPLRKHTTQRISRSWRTSELNEDLASILSPEEAWRELVQRAHRLPGKPAARLYEAFLTLPREWKHVIGTGYGASAGSEVRAERRAANINSIIEGQISAHRLALTAKQQQIAQVEARILQVKVDLQAPARNFIEGQERGALFGKLYDLFDIRRQRIVEQSTINRALGEAQGAFDVISGAGVARTFEDKFTDVRAFYATPPIEAGGIVRKAHQATEGLVDLQEIPHYEEELAAHLEDQASRQMRNMVNVSRNFARLYGAGAMGEPGPPFIAPSGIFRGAPVSMRGPLDLGMQRLGVEEVDIQRPSVLLRAENLVEQSFMRQVRFSMPADFMGPEGGVVRSLHAYAAYGDVARARLRVNPLGRRSIDDMREHYVAEASQRLNAQLSARLRSRFEDRGVSFEDRQALSTLSADTQVMVKRLMLGAPAAVAPGEVAEELVAGGLLGGYPKGRYAALRGQKDHLSYLQDLFDPRRRLSEFEGHVKQALLRVAPELQEVQAGDRAGFARVLRTIGSAGEMNLPQSAREYTGMLTAAEKSIREWGKSVKDWALPLERIYYDPTARGTAGDPALEDALERLDLEREAKELKKRLKYDREGRVLLDEGGRPLFDVDLERAVLGHRYNTGYGPGTEHFADLVGQKWYMRRLKELDKESERLHLRWNRYNEIQGDFEKQASARKDLESYIDQVNRARSRLYGEEDLVARAAANPADELLARRVQRYQAFEESAQQAIDAKQMIIDDLSTGLTSYDSERIERKLRFYQAHYGWSEREFGDMRAMLAGVQGEAAAVNPFFGISGTSQKLLSQLAHQQARLEMHIPGASIGGERLPDINVPATLTGTKIGEGRLRIKYELTGPERIEAWKRLVGRGYVGTHTEQQIEEMALEAVGIGGWTGGVQEYEWASILPDATAMSRRQLVERAKRLGIRQPQRMSQQALVRRVQQQLTSGEPTGPAFERIRQFVQSESDIRRKSVKFGGVHLGDFGAEGPDELINAKARELYARELKNLPEGLSRFGEWVPATASELSEEILDMTYFGARGQNILMEAASRMVPNTKTMDEDALNQFVTQYVMDFMRTPSRDALIKGVGAIQGRGGVPGFIPRMPGGGYDVFNEVFERVGQQLQQKYGLSWTTVEEVSNAMSGGIPLDEEAAKVFERTDVNLAEMILNQRGKKILRAPLSPWANVALPGLEQQYMPLGEMVLQSRLRRSEDLVSRYPQIIQRYGLGDPRSFERNMAEAIGGQMQKLLHPDVWRTLGTTPRGRNVQEVLARHFGELGQAVGDQGERLPEHLKEAYVHNVLGPALGEVTEGIGTKGIEEGAGAAAKAAEPIAKRPGPILAPMAKLLRENRVARYGAYGLAALGALGVVRAGLKAHKQDRTEDDMTGPPHLPGGNPYDGTLPTGQSYTALGLPGYQPLSGAFTGNNGMMYQINARGNFDPAVIQGQIEAITGGSAYGNVYSSPNSNLGTDRNWNEAMQNYG